MFTIVALYESMFTMTYQKYNHFKEQMDIEN